MGPAHQLAARPLTSHARKMLHLRTGVLRVVLNNTGSQAYVETGSASRGGVVVLGLYDTTTGKRIRLLSRLGPGGRHFSELSVSMDAAGQHLLVYGYMDFHRMAEMDLTTGHLAAITAAQPPVLDAAMTTAAW